MIIFFSTLKCFNLPSPAREMSAALSLTERQYFWQNNFSSGRARLQAAGSGLRFTSQETFSPDLSRNFSLPSASFLILTTMKGTKAPSLMSVTPTTSQGASRDILRCGGAKNVLIMISPAPWSALPQLLRGESVVSCQFHWAQAWLACFCWLWSCRVEWCEQGSQYLSYITAFLPSCESFFYLLSSHLTAAWLPPQHKSNLMNNDLLKWARAHLTFI